MCVTATVLYGSPIRGVATVRYAARDQGAHNGNEHNLPARRAIGYSYSYEYSYECRDGYRATEKSN